MADVYATLEQDSTHWLARVLEPGKEPRRFMPPKSYGPIGMKSIMCSAIMRAYPDERVIFVSGEKFNKLVAEAAGRVLTLPEDWPSLQFHPGQRVYVISSNGSIYDEITGIFRDELWEDGIPGSLVLRYRVLCHWYLAEELSLEPPASLVTAGAIVAEDDDLFLCSDDKLP